MNDLSNEEMAIVSYNLDPDFKSYVDKYAQKHNLTNDEAFDHEIVKLYLKYLEERNN